MFIDFTYTTSAPAGKAGSLTACVSLWCAVRNQRSWPLQLEAISVGRLEDLVPPGKKRNDCPLIPQLKRSYA